MAGNAVFDAVIQAVDKFSGVARKMAESMRGVTQAAQHANKASAEGAAHHARWFGALSGHVTLLRGHFGALRTTVGEVGHSITEFLPMLGALGAAGSLVGLFELTEHVAEARSQFVATALKIGITTQQLAAFNLAAKMTDVNVESMQGGMVKLDRSIALAAAGKNKDAAALFSHLGISLRDASGHLRTTADIMPQLADAMEHTHDPAMRVRMAMALFGRAGAEMIPMLLEGSKGLREFAEISKQVNYAPNAEEARGLEEFHRGWIKLTAAATGFSNAIGSKLAPVLTPVLEMFTEWMVTNRDWIATGMAGRVEQLAHWLQQLNLREIIDSTREWVTSLMETGHHLGGIYTVVGAVALALGSPLVNAVRGAIEIFGLFGKGLLWLTGIMWANPIIAAIGAVTLAAFLLYQNWDFVKEKVGAVFTWFSGQTGWVQTLLMVIAPLIFVPMKIIESWEPIKQFFVDLWDGVKAAFAGAWSYIEPIVNKISSAVGAIQNGWVGRHLGLNAPVTGSGGELPDNPMEYSDDGRGGVRGPIPSPFAPGSPAAGPAAGAAQSGKIEQHVFFHNAPAGTRIESRSTGIAPDPETSIGYALPIGAF